MRKIKLFIPFLSVLILSFFLISTIFAEETERTIMPPYEGRIFGQNHYYQVVFDGEGEAAVAAKLTLQNTTKEETSSTIVEIPGNNIRMIRAVQEVYEKEKECRNWEQICMEEEEGRCVRYERKCQEWYWRTRLYNPTYYTLEPEKEVLSNSIKYTFELESALKEQEQTALLLYYKVPEQAQKKRGIFYFTFETAKVPYDLDKVRVAVAVQEGFYLKGGEAKTEYKSNFQALEEAAPAMRGVESQSLSRFSSQIEYAKGYVKQTQGLDPWESFTVKGQYAESWFMLYKGKIISWIIGIIVFFVLLGLGIRWWIKKKGARIREEGTSPRMVEGWLPLKILGVAFGSVIAILIILLAGAFVLSNMSSWIGYHYSGFLALFVIIIEGIIVLALFFGPPIYMGVKYGLSIGVWTVLVSIGIMILLLILTFILLGASQLRPGPIRPLLEGSPSIK